MGSFFDMGGYAAFVWPAYGLTALVLLLLFVSAILALRRVQGRLAAREAERGPSQRRATRPTSPEKAHDT